MASKDHGNSQGEPIAQIDELDLWLDKEVRGRVEVEQISPNAIQVGSCLDTDEAKLFSRNLAADGNDNYCEVIALSADIRKSSITLVNVEDFAEYNRVLTDFICYMKDTWRNVPGRFFDKFTGDGALCFWVMPKEPEEDEAEREDEEGITLIEHYYNIWNGRIKETIEFSIDITCKFMEIFLPSFRKTCGLLPKEFGFSVGIDVGECFLTELRSSTSIAGTKDHYEVQYGNIQCPDPTDGEERRIIVANNVTMIGRPVIGATRMVEGANAYEILVNCYPGAALKDRIENPTALQIRIREKFQFGLDRAFRKVKDYAPGPVEVYRVNTDRINSLKKRLGICVEDVESPAKIDKDSNDKPCTQSKI